MYDFARAALAFFLLAAIDGVATRPSFADIDFGAAHGGGALASNDHHGGVSIVGAGGSAHKGITIDLTKHAGGDHTGLFGGSFIAAGGHGKSGADAHYQVAEAAHGDAGLGTYASALTSYDAGGAHDVGEISPVLYSSFKEGDHEHALNSAAAAAGFDHGALVDHLGAAFHH